MTGGKPLILEEKTLWPRKILHKDQGLLKEQDGSIRDQVSSYGPKFLRSSTKIWMSTLRNWYLPK